MRQFWCVLFLSLVVGPIAGAADLFACTLSESVDVGTETIVTVRLDKIDLKLESPLVYQGTVLKNELARVTEIEAIVTDHGPWREITVTYTIVPHVRDDGVTYTAHPEPFKSPSISASFYNSTTQHDLINQVTSTPISFSTNRPGAFSVVKQARYFNRDPIVDATVWGHGGTWVEYPCPGEPH